MGTRENRHVRFFLGVSAALLPPPSVVWILPNDIRHTCHRPGGRRLLRKSRVFIGPEDSMP